MEAPRFATWRVAALVLAVSSVIAIVLALVDSDSDLYTEMVISNSIGFSIYGSIRLLDLITGGRIGLMPILLISVPLGIVLGGKLAGLFGVHDIIGAFAADPRHAWRSVGASLLFAASASIFVTVSSQAAASRLELEIERRRSAEASRSQAVAELGLLQAQIEPHFLFNTLAHVQSAIDQDPEIGKQMLSHLIRYLRGTLTRSRSVQYTLTAERELVESLLSIAAIRLGSRLRSRVSIPDTLGMASLPPLLLQPLVENAIKHGIEPAIDGGEIHVDAWNEGDQLILRVTDTGLGMAAAGPEGVGLSNVRARLAALYGDRGRLTLQRHPERGVVAELHLPLRWSADPSEPRP
jgi:LytS/YehU family sensor histidine kinase